MFYPAIMSRSPEVMATQTKSRRARTWRDVPYFWVLPALLYAAIGCATAARMIAEPQAEIRRSAPSGGSPALAELDEVEPFESSPEIAGAPPLSTLPLTGPAHRPPPPPEARPRVARKLEAMWTRDADQLYSTIRDAYSESSPLPVTFLLAIAHAETNGKILTVSEAGAVGLAQATPIAYLSEGFSGKLFLTDDYVRGARAYFLKKPLNDADFIASRILEGGLPYDRAMELLRIAFKVRREGIEELQYLNPVTSPGHAAEVERVDRSNRGVLEELERLLSGGSSRAELQAFRDRVRADYRAMRDLQRVSWKRYQMELVAERDAMLRREYGDAGRAKRERAYEASEFLGRELDERFSATAMARFLDEHIKTKYDEARELGLDESLLEEMTAALYNGGAHNVKRMISGLMPQLPETDRYKEKVPATRRLLDEVIMLEEEPVDSARAPAAKPRGRG
jgi:hypothetical protein